MVSIFVKLNFKHFLLYKISLGSTSISNGNGSGPPQRFIYLSLSTYFHCWSRKWLLTPVFLPGKFCGQRSLAGYSPWNCNRVRHNFREGNGTPLQYSCLEKSQGPRSLVGCSPWGLEESDTTERLHFHFSLSCIGEGNGNPLQCLCLENPRDGGAWWAAVYGVAQSWTRLKRFSRNSMIML